MMNPWLPAPRPDPQPVAASDTFAVRVARRWLEHLPPGSHGPAEAVDADETPIDDGVRTVMPQARLAYVWTHAGLLGDAVAAGAGRDAIARVHRDFWDPKRGGWVRAVGPRGEVVDATLDTYDQAFALFALAWHYRATGDARARAIACETLRRLDIDAGDAVLGGYQEARGAAPRAEQRQNPHMHLLEAFLAWQAVDPNQCWLDHATSIVRLFRDRFCDPGNGTLIEFFDHRWQASLPRGALREPGHHFEWVWLLRRYEEASGDSGVRPMAATLHRFAMAHGLDAAGRVVDVTDRGGKVVEATQHLWPQTERLKAHLAMYEWTRDAAELEAASAVLQDIRRHWMRRGFSWHNGLDAGGVPLREPTPVRVLYHLFLAVAEAGRFGIAGAAGPL